MGTLTFASQSLVSSVGAIWNSVYCSIANDSNQKQHIVFGNPTGNKIIYGNNTGSGWSFWDAGNMTYAIDGSYNSIAIDKNENNKIHARWKNAANLYYGSSSLGPTWYNKDVGANYASESYDRTIAVDSNHKIIMSGYDYANGDLVCLSSSDGGLNWNVVTIDSTGIVGLRHSLAIDSNDRVHVSYLDETNDVLWYVNNTGSDANKWDKYLIQTIGGGEGAAYYQWCSIAVDYKNKVHICGAGNHPTEFRLMYYTNTGSTSGTNFDMFTASVDTGQGFSYETIAIDRQNRAHIAYWVYDDTAGEGGLYYCNNTGSDGLQWASYCIDDRAVTAGRFPSIAVDDNSKAHIVYYNSGMKQIWYATVAPAFIPSYAASSLSVVPPNGCAGRVAATLSPVGGLLGDGAEWYYYANACGGSYIGTGNSLVVNPSGTIVYYVRASGTVNTTDCVNAVWTDTGIPVVGFINGYTTISSGSFNAGATNSSAGNPAVVSVVSGSITGITKTSPVADGTYYTSGSTAGCVASITVTNGIITAITTI